MSYMKDQRKKVVLLKLKVGKTTYMVKKQK